MIFMNRSDADENRFFSTKAETDALALIQSLNARGRVAPIPDGTVIQNRYRIERFIRGSDLRNQYLVSWTDPSGGRLCRECGFEYNSPSEPKCSECQSPLGNREFILTERWRPNFQPYLEVLELGLFHSGLARIYEVFEEARRLFTVIEPVNDGYLADQSSPLEIDDLIRTTLQGCDVLEYLHSNGIGLTLLSREYFAFQEDAFLLLDPEISAIHPGEVPKAQRILDVRYFARIMREFVRFDSLELKSVFEKAYEGRYEYPAHFAEALLDLIPRLPPAREDGQWSAAAMSDVGMCRTLNEDNWGWEKLSDDISFFVVADGMGGHDGGEIASELAAKVAVDGVRRRLREVKDTSEDTLAALLDEAFREANNTVKVYSEKHRSDMGTTLTGVLFNKNGFAIVANVGDSRAYCIRGDELIQISEDHSLVANLVAMGKITKEAARNHPHSNILIRTVGKEWDVEIDIFHHDFQPGDTFLLCSDGLWGEVDESDIVSLVRNQPDVRVACQELVRSANDHGGHDNVTTLLVRIQ